MMQRLHDKIRPVKRRSSQNMAWVVQGRKIYIRTKVI